MLIVKALWDFVIAEVDVCCLVNVSIARVSVCVCVCQTKAHRIYAEEKCVCTHLQFDKKMNDTFEFERFLSETTQTQRSLYTNAVRKCSKNLLTFFLLTLNHPQKIVTEVVLETLNNRWLRIWVFWFGNCVFEMEKCFIDKWDNNNV